jgi:hypothetical protein
LVNSAKFDPGSTLRFVQRHARANIFRYQHFQVGTNLLVQVYLHTSRQKEISQETSSFHKEGHGNHLNI